MTDIKTDFLGNELQVGDEIVFMEINYRTLKRGTILKLNNKKLTIEFPDPWKGDPDRKATTMQFYYQVVKISN